MRRHAVTTDRLAKRYLLGTTPTASTAREAIAQLARRAVGREPRRATRELWALRDVSLAVEEGRCLGIVGANGSGKSTLLKILTRITDPTEGTAMVRGRVGALLEVGAGFHPELTGRENVHLAGAVLGMPLREVRRRFDDIVAFSGVATHLDTPVKRYSSGMYLRLAFAVAAHLDPDVLIVDEALTVGDAEFQRRCYDRVASMVGAGTTVLYVSHDLSSVTALCDDVLWLDGGEMRAMGPARDVVSRYLEATVPAVAAVHHIGGAEEVTVDDLAVVASQGTIAETDDVSLEATVTVHEVVEGVEVVLAIATLTGTVVMAESARRGDETFGSRPGRYTVRLDVPALLAPGDYLAEVWVYDRDDRFAPFSASTRFEVHERTPVSEPRLVRLPPPVVAPSPVLHRTGRA